MISRLLLLSGLIQVQHDLEGATENEAGAECQDSLARLDTEVLRRLAIEVKPDNCTSKSDGNPHREEHDGETLVVIRKGAGSIDPASR